jgi:hypothetical protein
MANKLQVKIKNYLKYKQHVHFVTTRTLELRSNICSQACLYGTVDETTRTLYLKYNNRLIELEKRK